MEEKEKQIQEMYLEFQQLEQYIKQLQRQLEVITHQLMEISAASNSLDEFKKITPAKEVFVPLSSGIFAKASINDNSELLVNVGANVGVTKDIDSTKKLISNQLEEIKKIHQQTVEELEKMTHRASQLESMMQRLVQQE